MKKLTILNILSCIVVMLAFTVLNAQAATIWIPNASGEIDVNTSTYTTDTLGICDDLADPNAPGASILLFKTGLSGSDTIHFTVSGSDWIITSINTGNSITLADSDHFKVVWLNGSTWIEDNGYTEAVPDSQYWVDFPGLAAASSYNNPNDSALKLIDVKLATPIPAAFYLFGTGLLACIGLKNKRDSETRQKS